jgi:hypothetical protein
LWLLRVAQISRRQKNPQQPQSELETWRISGIAVDAARRWRTSGGARLERTGDGSGGGAMSSTA